MEKPGVKAVDKGKFILIDNFYSTPLYNLKEPWLVETGSDSFYIQYKSENKTILEIFFENEIKKEFNLPDSKGIIQYQAALDAGDLIVGFRVKSTHPEIDNKSFQIMDVGIEKTNYGLSIKKYDDFSVTVISQGFEIENSNTYLFKELSGKAVSQVNQVRISLTYNYTVNGDGNQEIIIFSENHNKSFGLNPRTGGTVIDFYSKSLGFIPTGFTVTNNDPGFSVTDVSITPFSLSEPVDYKPIPADIGTMLNYPNEVWRRSDLEIFSWNLFPDILILDFRDYRLQSASLKRLAFFVEKKGFTGQLLDNETLSGLHGWNAHNYRAKDLAAFFTMAEKNSFELNTEEYEIMNILLSNKIIMKTDKGYEPLSGSILSYSMESSSRLRYLFLTHEGYHGIFFSDLEFVSEVQVIWNSLDEQEKQFWYDFLAWKRYDIENPYLVVNEFMAYLMQQRIEDIESYYKDYIIPKYLIAFPDDSEKMDEFLLKYPDHFLENAKRVEASAYKLNSINAGDLRCLY